MCCKIILTIRVNKKIKNLGMKSNKRSNEASLTIIISAMFKVKMSKYDVTMVYLLPIIIHFWLSNHFKIFRKCSRMVILLIFAKKYFFDFFEKSQIMFWGNWMRNPRYMDIFFFFFLCKSPLTRLQKIL